MKIHYSIVIGFYKEMIILEMTLRWFGSKNDSVTLSQIHQIPGVTGVITALDLPAGEVWQLEDILALKREVEAENLKICGIESVNVHEDIKLNLPTAQKYIDNYKETLINLSKAGIHLVTYNFMPIFDWTRSDLAKQLVDGSNALSYDEDVIKKINPTEMFLTIEKNSNGFHLPGWEPERIGEIKKLFELYQSVDEAQLFKNLENFLRQVIPVAEEHHMKLAIHPDDPPWGIFGLPRIVTSKENIERLLHIIDSPSNGLALCSGSLGANPDNNIPALIRYFGEKGKIHFAHVRNIKIHERGKFDEVSHRTCDGSLDMFAIIKAYHDIGFEGPMRPDHGRMIWGEKARPGYGLFDRALGATYLNGLWEAIDRLKK